MKGNNCGLLGEAYAGGKIWGRRKKNEEILRHRKQSSWILFFSSRNQSIVWLLYVCAHLGFFHRQQEISALLCARCVCLFLIHLITLTHRHTCTHFLFCSSNWASDQLNRLTESNGRFHLLSAYLSGNLISNRLTQLHVLYLLCPKTFIFCKK